MKKGTNSAIMRRKNEKIILSLINRKPLSRIEISKKTDLTKAAVTIIVDDLIQRGLVIEKNTQTKSVGRNPVLLFLNEKALYMVGVNITRHNIYTGISDLGGNIITEDSFPLCSPDKALLKIKGIIENQIKESGLDISAIYRISVVTPGPVDAENGIILNPPNFNEWHNIAICNELYNLTGIETMLENVSAATAIAEKYFGNATDASNFLSLLVDEGIGSGIVVDDLLFKGPCELGHTSIKFDGIKCECGNHGCLEKYASIPRILESTDYKSWEEAVDADDPEILGAESDFLSTAIISANNIFNFEKIVLCGDLTYKPKKITSLIAEKTVKNVLSGHSFKVCAGKVKSKVLIAASTAINNFFVQD